MKRAKKPERSNQSKFEKIDLDSCVFLSLVTTDSNTGCDYYSKDEFTNVMVVRNTTDKLVILIDEYMFAEYKHILDTVILDKRCRPLVYTHTHRKYVELSDIVYSAYTDSVATYVPTEHRGADYDFTYETLYDLHNPTMRPYKPRYRILEYDPSSQYKGFSTNYEWLYYMGSCLFIVKSNDYRYKTFQFLVDNMYSILMKLYDVRIWLNQEYEYRYLELYFILKEDSTKDYSAVTYKYLSSMVAEVKDYRDIISYKNGNFLDNTKKNLHVTRLFDVKRYYGFIDSIKKTNNSLVLTIDMDEFNKDQGSCIDSLIENNHVLDTNDKILHEIDLGHFKFSYVQHLPKDGTSISYNINLFNEKRKNSYLKEINETGKLVLSEINLSK